PRRVVRRPLDAHMNEGPLRRAADSEVGQLETQDFQSGPKRLDEAVGEHDQTQKKARAELRPLQRRNLAARLRLSSRGQRQPEIRDHAPVAPARSAVRKKLVAVV